MKTILIQGINANVGASTIASAITYQLSELGKTAVLIDGSFVYFIYEYTMLNGVFSKVQSRTAMAASFA